MADSNGKSRLATITQQTLVPLGVALAATGVGWWWRDREASKDAEVTGKLSALERTVVVSGAAIEHKLDLALDRFAALGRELGEARSAMLTRDQHATWTELLGASNPTLTLPGRR